MNIIIIGATSGIGKALYEKYAADVNYRTEETSGEDANVKNSHACEYDANGNLIYVNTSREKKDGESDEKTGERKLRWDEENRLLSSDDNGFVTNYWYDADGERTVKTSGEGEQIYVNSEFAGGRTNTAKFSLYVSPYLVANQGGRYTKHIYIGSQRIVNKLGDFDSYEGSLPLPSDLIAEDLKIVLAELGTITGATITSQETLNHIFASFCVGK